MGWVHHRRDLGGLFFIDLRDRHGTTQVVFRPDDDSELHARAGELGAEYVIAVRGEVSERPEGTVNADLPTGEVEVIAREMFVLNASLTPPFVLEEPVKASDELRLEYRYLDLRREDMLGNLIGQVLIPGREVGYMLSTTTMAIIPGTKDLLIGAGDFAGRGAWIFKAKTFAKSWDGAYQFQKR